jgi:hypothetical protein
MSKKEKAVAITAVGATIRESKNHTFAPEANRPATAAIAIVDKTKMARAFTSSPAISESPNAAVRRRRAIQCHLAFYPYA